MDDSETKRYCPHCSGPIRRHPVYDNDPKYDSYECITPDCISFQLYWTIKFLKKGSLRWKELS